MVRALTPAGLVFSKLVADKTGKRFIRDPATGKYWPLEVCQLVTATDQSPDPCPTITERDWQSLKEAAREMRIPNRLFICILERVTGIPATAFRGRQMSYDQWAEILRQLEEAAFILQVSCPVEPYRQGPGGHRQGW